MTLPSESRDRHGVGFCRRGYVTVNAMLMVLGGVLVICAGSEIHSQRAESRCVQLDVSNIAFYRLAALTAVVFYVRATRTFRGIRIECAAQL